MNFEFKLYDFGNLDELSDIYKKCFNTFPPTNYFKWKYLDNPSGEAIAFVAIHNNKIASFYGVIPEIYVVGGERVTIYQSMDTMTHPDYQRMGLFNKLAKITYSYIKEHHLQLNLIGFPGETSYPGFIKKLNWHTLIELNYSFTLKPIYNIRRLFHKKSMAEIEKIISFNDEFDLYFNDKKYIEKTISKYMNISIANWRFTNSPVMNYSILKISEEKEIKGYVIYRIDEKMRVFIINIDVIHTDKAQLYIQDIFSYLFQHEDTSIIYTFQSSTKLIQKTLNDNWFISNPFLKGPFSYKTPFIVYGDLEINNIDFFNLKNWDIQPYLRDY